MNVRFLLFRGANENEGNFSALESEKTIIILAAGQDYALSGSEEQQLGCSYLKENRDKIQGIIVNNTTFHNTGFLAQICQELGQQIPIYTSVHNKLVLHYLYPQIKNRIVVMMSASPPILIGDFTCSFFPLPSYLLGNCVVAFHHSQYSFYLLEEVLLNNCWNNELLFPPLFLTEFNNFLTSRGKTNYLITSFTNIYWQTNNSLFAVADNFFPPEKTKFWILYEFDWLHILELLVLSRQHQKKVRILNERFLLLVRQILAKSSLGQVISREGEIILLVVNHNNIETEIDYHLQGFPVEQKSNFHFLLGLPPVIGKEESLAELVDYLHAQSEEVTNLSKKEYFNFRTSLSDWKLLIPMINPHGILLLQNSYKNAKFLPYLSGPFLTLPNHHAYQFFDQKITPLKVKKTLTTLEEILIKQRKNLQEGGLLIFLFVVNWQEEKLILKKLRLELFGINPSVNLLKLEKKIKDWWEEKLTFGLNREDSTKVIKETVKRRCNELVKSYLSSEHDIELEELPILLFLK